MIWIISLLAIAGVLFRPFGRAEWVWALSGAVLLVVTGLLPIEGAEASVFKGVDVYLFLIGMMLLAEMARAGGVFDYVSSHACRQARGSSHLLFLYMYLAGTAVTVFLSNDATAVVLTPAIYSAVKKSGAVARPYLFACALIANAASFVLPISNPANLVVYQSHLPPIGEWLATFFLPSLLAVVVTYLVLILWFRAELKRPLPGVRPPSPKLSSDGKIAFAGISGVIGVLLFSSAQRWDLGFPTLLSTLILLLGLSLRKRRLPREELKGVSWGVIPLVGGLFVIVEALNRAGALDFATRSFLNATNLPALRGKFVAAFGVGIFTNVFNNLPVGLTSALAVGDPGVSLAVKNAVLVGVDLGPNLSVTGSLATILWIIVLRREGESIRGRAFFAVGLVAMPLALAAALLVL